MSADHAAEQKQLEALANELEGVSSHTQALSVESLTEEQKGKLATMRAELESAGVEGIEADNWLLKHLQFHSYDVAAAVKSYTDMKAWRAANKIDEVLSGENPKFNLFRLLIPHGYFGFDKDGSPIYMEITGRSRVEALTTAVTEADMIASHTYGMETLRRSMTEQSAKLGKPVDTFTSILDMDGLSFYHRNVIHLLRAVTDFDNKNYPNMVGKVFVINSGWVVPSLFALVKPLLHESITNKIHILGADYKDTLLKYIDEDQIPAAYGGSHPDSIFEGTDEELKALTNVDAFGVQLSEHEVLNGVSFDMELAAGEGDRVVWSFEVKYDYDVDFSVTLTLASEPDSPIPIAPKSRSKQGRGEYVATGPCTIKVSWDNTFSWYNSKHIKYSAAVHPASSS